MFRVSRETDYGIVLLTRIARDTSRTTFAARDLAEASQISLPMVSKILKRLARAGVLASLRGAHGGYQLVRPAADISVADIISALDGPIAMMPCIESGPGECDREPHCRVRDNWQLINSRVLETLRQISLEEMAGNLTEESFAMVGFPSRMKTMESS